jgi:hypothetical protein
MIYSIPLTNPILALKDYELGSKKKDEEIDKLRKQIEQLMISNASNVPFLNNLPEKSSSPILSARSKQKRFYHDEFDVRRLPGSL